MKKRLFSLSFILISVLGLQAQWISTGGPVSGNNSCFAVSDTNIFRGAWSSPTPAGGLYRSTINGTNWTLVYIGVPGPWVTSLAVRGRYIFAGCSGGVYRSADYGLTWAPASFGLTNTDVVALAVSDTNLYCGTYKGVFLSTNNGETWTAVNTSFPIVSTPFIVDAFAVIGNKIFAGTDGYGVFTTSDNGANWTPVSAGLGSAGERVFSLAVLGTDLVAGCLNGVYISSDLGENWIYSTAMGNVVIYSLAVSGNTIFAGFNYGVKYSSDKGASWAGVSAGLPGSQVYALGVIGTYLFAGNFIGQVYKRELSEMIPTVSVLPNKTVSGFNLDQNHPNPFTSGTTISWHSTRSIRQTLKVFDYLGFEVATLVDEIVPAGDHKINFDSFNLPDGVYYYSLHAGKYNSTRKMVLIK